MDTMKEDCKYCGNKVEIKSSLSMNGHITNCSKFKEWRDGLFTYDMLYAEYIINGKSALQIANENGWSSSTIVNKQLRRLNIPVRSVKQSHYMDGYRDRIEKTNLKKYGAINPLSTGTVIFHKRNKTVKEKYGVDNIFQHRDVKEKIKNTNIDKYGAHTPICKNSSLHTNYMKTIYERYGTNNASKSDIIRKKQRLITLKKIEEQIGRGGQIIPSYNMSSISILEEKAKELGITDLQHAENGGEYYIKELGYFVDGYSKEKNIVIEYDEKHHFDENGNLCEKDIIRQCEIETLLGCKFIRIRCEN